MQETTVPSQPCYFQQAKLYKSLTVDSNSFVIIPECLICLFHIVLLLILNCNHESLHSLQGAMLFLPSNHVAFKLQLQPKVHVLNPQRSLFPSSVLCSCQIRIIIVVIRLHQRNSQFCCFYLNNPISLSLSVFLPQSHHCFCFMLTEIT